MYVCMNKPAKMNIEFTDEDGKRTSDSFVGILEQSIARYRDWYWPGHHRLDLDSKRTEVIIEVVDSLMSVLVDKGVIEDKDLQELVGFLVPKDNDDLKLLK